MKTLRSSKWVIAGAAMVLLTGGLVLGSNMGFKFNMPIDGPGVNPPPAGSNRMSFPLFNPYADTQAVCDQLGLQAGVSTVGEFDPVAFGVGASVTHICGNGGTNFVQTKGRALWLTDPNLVTAGSAIVVGSHDPTFTYNLAGQCVNPAPCGDNWVSYPYHGTAVDAQDVCDDIGGNTQTIGEFDPNGPSGLGFGSLTTHICGNLGTNFNLTIGRGLKVNVTVNTAWIASHF